MCEGWRAGRVEAEMQQTTSLPLAASGEHLLALARGHVAPEYVEVLLDQVIVAVVGEGAAEPVVGHNAVHGHAISRGVHGAQAAEGAGVLLLGTGAEINQRLIAVTRRAATVQIPVAGDDHLFAWR